jgi:hypothetical protein
MVYLHTQNTNLDLLCRELEWEMLLYFMANWYILWSFGIFCDHLIYISGYEMLYQVKSGNPVGQTCMVMYCKAEENKWQKNLWQKGWRPSWKNKREKNFEKMAAILGRILSLRWSWGSSSPLYLLFVSSSVTWLVCEKNAQSATQPIFLSTLIHISYGVKK